MKTHYEHIMFRKVPRKKQERRVTDIWQCYTQPKERGGIMYPLGTVKWMPQWRQYCFFPPFDGLVTIFSAGCLQDIQDFLKQAMKVRGDGRATQSKSE